MGGTERDGTIDLFFKPQDAEETGTTMIRMARPSMQKQIEPPTGLECKRDGEDLTVCARGRVPDLCGRLSDGKSHIGWILNRELLVEGPRGVEY